MKTIVKTENIIQKVDQAFYVAWDGKEFNSYGQCAKHELKNRWPVEKIEKYDFRFISDIHELTELINDLAINDWLEDDYDVYLGDKRPANRVKWYNEDICKVEESADLIALPGYVYCHIYKDGGDRQSAITVYTANDILNEVKEAAQKMSATLDAITKLVEPQLDSTCDNMDLQAVIDKLAINTPYPIGNIIPRCPRKARLTKDGKLEIYYHEFGNESQIVSSYYFDLDDEGKTWRWSNNESD